jgi:hypothetical protein
MFIKKDKVTSIQERTFEEYAKYRSLVNEELMDEYKALLKGIAEKGEYQEGEMITDGDLASINKSVKKILEVIKTYSIIFTSLLLCIDNRKEKLKE